jgi:hypothetical protein
MFQRRKHQFFIILVFGLLCGQRLGAIEKVSIEACILGLWNLPSIYERIISSYYPAFPPTLPLSPIGDTDTYPLFGISVETSLNDHMCFSSTIAFLPKYIAFAAETSTTKYTLESFSSHFYLSLNYYVSKSLS